MTRLAYRSSALVLIMVLAGCQAKPASEAASEAQGAPAVADVAGKAGGDTAVTVPQLAYDYSFGFTADADGVEALLKADQAACERAGVTACQIVALNADANRDERYVNKTLELRVSPAWLKTWQAGLDAAVARVHGRIGAQNVTSEDLSLQIVDTEAHLKNKEALRDRLAEIIRHSPGKISELIEAETQLSEVQTEIDAARSALAVMQKRVATVHVTLSYQSAAVAASSGTFAPVVDASKGVLRNVVSVFGGLITLLSFVLPLGLVGVPAVWFGGRWLKSRRKPDVEPKILQE